MCLLLLCLAAMVPAGGDPNKVNMDSVNSLEILEYLEIPEGIKDLRDANFTEPISNYPYSGHWVAPSELLLNESKKMRDFYWSCSATEDQMYRHPVGNQQFGVGADALDNAKRVKARLVLDPSFGEIQSTGLYAPPGELITIEIPDSAKGKLSVGFNTHTRDLDFWLGPGYWGRGSWERLPYVVQTAVEQQGE